IKGEFLEGFSIKDASQFDDWMTAEREHWRRRSVEVLLNRADELLAAGGVAAALELGERALELDRESEAALRALMRGLTLAGDRSGALKRFEAFAARLERELGTEPAPETRALAAQVRLERTWRLPKAAAAEAKRAPLVGRARELGQLDEAWTTCRRDRHPALAVIDGDAGAGETRLADELVARARLDGAVVAGVRAVARDLARSPLLVLCTATPHPPRVELDELRARIGRYLKGTAVRVGPFTSDAVRALAHWALPSFDDVQLDRLTRRVATDSAGIP